MRQNVWILEEFFFRDFFTRWFILYSTSTVYAFKTTESSCFSKLKVRLHWLPLSTNVNIHAWKFGWSNYCCTNYKYSTNSKSQIIHIKILVKKQNEKNIARCLLLWSSNVRRVCVNAFQCIIWPPVVFAI